MESRITQKQCETLPVELIDYIINQKSYHEQQHLFHIFAQTSSSWRIESYFSLLKKAYKESDHHQQQMVLTMLYLNHSLLLKPSCKLTLKSNLKWLIQYRCAEDILLGTRFITLALLIIVQPKHEKAYQREFMLSAIGLMQKGKSSLINAVLAILAQSRESPGFCLLSQLCLTESKKDKIDDGVFWADDTDETYTLAEALLVLASLPADNNDKWFFSKIHRSFGVHQHNQYRSHELQSDSYANFLHAALIQLSGNNSFWKNNQSIIHFIYGLIKVTEQNTAAMSFMMHTLTKYIADPEFIDNFLKNNIETIGETAFAKMLKNALEATQCRQEAERVEWLNKYLYSNLEKEKTRNRYFPICSVAQHFLNTLETEEAIQTAIQHLYQFFLKAHNVNQYLAVTIIMQLLPKIKSEEFWQDWMNKLSTNLQSIPSYNGKKGDIIDILVSSLSFLPSEKMANLWLVQLFNLYERQSPYILNGKLLIALCWRLSSASLIQEWINNFNSKVNISITSANTHGYELSSTIENLVYLECYAILLSKLAGKAEAQDKITYFMPQLFVLFHSLSDQHNLFKAAEKMLPYLKEDEKIDKWFELFFKLRDPIFNHGSQTKNRKWLIRCFIVLLKISNHQHQANYIEKFNNKFINGAQIDDIILPLIVLAQKEGHPLIDKLIAIVLLKFKHKDLPSLSFYVNHHEYLCSEKNEPLIFKLNNY